ncbi:MAG: hypothetical protein HWE25_03180 [Alphaproteobacteria bacterium]|nr:hypothetical protein [Alphaproteobacteria bacterium]
MKYLITLLLFLCPVNVAGACSYSMPTPLRALQQLDLLIEGELVAIYLNETQVSIAEMRDLILMTQGPVKIRMAVAPSKYYFGTKDALLEINTLYDEDDPCNGGIFFDSKSELWGARYLNGKFVVSNFSNHLAHYAQNLVHAAEVYGTLLKGTAAEVTTQSFIQSELTFIEKIIKGGRGLTKVVFATDPTELTALSPEILKARLRFLEHLAFSEEVNRTRNAILLKE